MELFQSTINDKLKNYDVHLGDIQFFKKYYYPPIFVQGSHISDIEGVVNQNDKNSFYYGLKTKPKSGSMKKSKKTKKTKSKY